MFRYVSPEIYERYKEEVLRLSPAVQVYEGTTADRRDCNLTDREIAERLGLDVSTVTEIRCIAELDLLPTDAWLEAENWKEQQARRAAENLK